MALFKPILGELSGKIGGNVFAHNRGGSYVRAWKIPTDPNSTDQQIVRTAMANMVVYWTETLTNDQRTAWATYAANVPMKNRLGETIYLTGQNHFIRSNVPRSRCGLTIVADGPTTYNLGEFEIILAWGDEPDNITVFFNDEDTWCFEDNSHLIVQQGVAQQQTINFYKSPFRYIDTIDGIDPGGVETPGFLTSYYALQDDQLVFIRLRVTRNDGRLSASQIMSFIIGAAKKAEK